MNKGDLFSPLHETKIKINIVTVQIWFFFQHIDSFVFKFIIGLHKFSYEIQLLVWGLEDT